MKKTHIIALLILVLATVVGIVAYVYVFSPKGDVPMSATPVASSTIEQTDSLEEATPVEGSTVVPALVALDMKTWEWVRAEFADGNELLPKKPDVFTLAFGGSGTVEIGTDCNSMSSTYEAYSGALTFGPIAGTKMYCEGSQEAEYASLLEKFATYQFTGKGELIVKTSDGTKVIFK
ncbi:MAG: hypothetical protein RL538_43 [Candidatus Parcubacteria bacterium]|jgi:heat shock protein HslJ